MNCSDFLKRVSSYPDRSLPVAERSALDEHGSVCPICGPELKVFRAMRDGFAALPAIGTTDEFGRRVVRRVARERDDGLARVVEFPVWARRVGLALAAGLLLFVGWQVVRRDGGVRREIAAESPARSSEELTVARGTDVSRDRSTAGESRASTTSAPRVASAARDARPPTRSEALDILLGQGGIPLAPPGSERKYVIDRAADLPRLLSEGAEGELASTPISF